MDLDFFEGPQGSDSEMALSEQDWLDISEYLKMALSIRIWPQCDDWLHSIV